MTEPIAESIIVRGTDTMADVIRQLDFRVGAVTILVSEEGGRVCTVLTFARTAWHEYRPEAE